MKIAAIEVFVLGVTAGLLATKASGLDSQSNLSGPVTLNTGAAQ